MNLGGSGVGLIQRQPQSYFGSNLVLLTRLYYRLRLLVVADVGSLN